MGAVSIDQHEPGFSYSSLVYEIRESGLTTAEIAAVTGVQERQVQHWAAGTSRPRDETRDRLVDVHYLVRQLAEVYRAEGIQIWLHARNRELEGARPIDLLVAGEFEPVVHAVSRLQSGAMG
jgi:transcriptional regulator with XRE-family HTH domain